MNLERVIQALAPTDVVQRAPVEISDLAYDTRAVTPGALFFCIRGERHDGHDFAPDAIGRGAAALVVDHPLDVDIPQLVVLDPRSAMAQAAVVFFGDPTRELEVVGVTGTNGKTTVTFLLASILEAAGRSPGLIGTIETRVGGEGTPAARTTPEAIDLQRAFRAMLDAGDRSCALEATSHGSALGRLAGVRFAALAFTNLSQDHLDFHGTLEHYFEAKRRLFVLGERPPAAVNVGDAHGRRLAADLQSLRHEPLLTFGFGPDADIRAEDVVLGRGGASFRVDGLRVRTRMHGRFNVENALAAVAVGRLVGIDDEAIASGIAGLRGVPGRFEAVDEGQPFTVVVDYSHKPDALANVLHTARELTQGRVICVFGCGGDRDRGKRPVMGAIAAKLADVVIVTSDNPRSEDPEAIVAEVVEGAGPRADVELDRAAAIERAIELAREDDVVVIAGKGHEQGQEFADRTIPFDDRAVARDALRRLGAAV